MTFDESYTKLPNVYKRAGRECYLDPIRNKLIYVTPEETVRQRMLSFLMFKMNIDSRLITVEEHISHYGAKSKQRTDIVILAINEDGEEYPICVIECKAPDVPLTEEVANQLFDYSDQIESDYAFMTNGYVTICYRYDLKSDDYTRIESIPSYQDMIEGKYTEYDFGEYPERIPFDKLADSLTEQNERYSDPHEAYDISPMTDMSIAVPAFNLFEGLLDYRIKFPKREYRLFTVIDDIGVRMLTYGNSSGGKFSGPYRSFIIKKDDDTEVVSLSVTTYWKSSSADIIRTALVVAIENEKVKHHALQLVLDDNLVVDNNTCYFYHSGRIAVGDIGSGKISELREFVKMKYPEIIKGERFYLGSLVHDRLWRLDDEEVVKLIENLISYALIRDEYREYKKSQNKK